jgi:AcrR family transcriptional regulator
MTAITGGTEVAGVDTPSQTPPVALPAWAPPESIGFQPGSTEVRVLDAVVSCAARWGMEKTTVDDVAREAGVSRATVYRLFPGGKPAMVRMATDREAVELLAEAMSRVAACEALEAAVTELISAGHDTLCSQAVLAFMRANEPAKLRIFFSFDRLDSLLEIAADVVSPSLERFLDPAEARIVVIWVARLVVSHFVHPDDVVNLSDPADARRLCETHILPGLRIQQDPPHPRSNANDHQ